MSACGSSPQFPASPVRSGVLDRRLRGFSVSLLERFGTVWVSTAVKRHYGCPKWRFTAVAVAGIPADRLRRIGGPLLASSVPYGLSALRLPQLPRMGPCRYALARGLPSGYSPPVPAPDNGSIQIYGASRTPLEQRDLGRAERTIATFPINMPSVSTIGGFANYSRMRLTRYEGCFVN